ncbi:Protein kinase C-like 3 [Frankliniella fusca]|uniref:Protein kinase C-like 3 n=1 Tax=Frankliniella fusca TaxID=407009 RepID=A0AAE1HLR4_9NEOP|nr:Protein kinase C-like 3 [Frankliniella fusca]
MADLADKIDDLICSFEGGGDTTMDTVAMLMFGWMVFGLFVLGIGKFIYAKYIRGGNWKGSNTVPPITTTSSVIDDHPVKAAAVKELRSSASSGGAYVPPTPPVRKRIGSTKRGSSVGPLKNAPKLSPVHLPPPATGPDPEAVHWVNQVFAWLYSDPVTLNELLGVWVQSLNESTRKSVAEAGVGVEFVRILPETHAPTLTNIFAECDSRDDITITCDCDATPALQLKAFRQKGEKVEVSHYRVNVNRFRARLNIVCITEKMLADLKCDGWPEIKVSLAPVGSIKNNLDEQQLQDVIIDIVSTAIRMSNVHLNLSMYPDFPQFSRHAVQAPHILPVHYDSMMSAPYSGGRAAGGRRLLVKVIKAQGLGAKQGCKEPYCIVEMDEPSQKYQTSMKKDTDSPVWDEHFLFDVSPNTAELLFEIYDRSGLTQTSASARTGKFLGLGIVGVEELLINPSQRQVISLQSRPYEADPVSGTLTAEFLFIEGADIPAFGGTPYKLKETLKTTSPSGAVITTTKTVFANAGEHQLSNGGERVTESALKELELRNRGQPLQTDKSTLIIHKRGRSRRKKRDFFGTIKRRLNRSKVRSKSVDPGDNENRDQSPSALSRSISADRAHDGSQHSSSGYLTVPGLRADSTRSSLSEASGISGASTRTYINEASNLVLETLENGIHKYYLVPLSLAQKTKWRKKGTKLHIFNDHTFIAKHLTGGTVCQICAKTVARRIGKQGYECRDCLLKCHKQCHVKVDTTCPNSNIQNIELCPMTMQSPQLIRQVLTRQSKTKLKKMEKLS